MKAFLGNQSINVTPIMREIVSEKHEVKTNKVLNHFMISCDRIKTNDSAEKYRKE